MRITSPVAFYEPGNVLLRFFGPPLDGLPAGQDVADLMGVPAAWRGRGIQVAVPAAPSWRFQIHLPSLEEATAKRTPGCCCTLAYTRALQR
ncbi:hypothetical protein [Streptomyces mirabilis]|uniref:hypothetical protein n=1 Tax=Streptomyces mirabilis TaxID=68239 RepID=UPI0036501F50